MSFQIATNTSVFVATRIRISTSESEAMNFSRKRVDHPLWVKNKLLPQVGLVHECHCAMSQSM